MHKPGYSVLLSSGELKKRVDILREMLKNCVLCPHQCKVNRLKRVKG
jgi:putative pyruvate formate lyase activating enzyme